MENTEVLYVVAYAVIVLGGLGLLAALILYIVARRFAVVEDERIDLVQAVLPGANCGGCGYPGCRTLAESCVKNESLEGLFCPVGGNAVMSQIASILGLEANDAAAQVAIVKCNGSPENRARSNVYDGAGSCAVMHSLYIGDTECVYGCLGCGDCVEACQFGAIAMNVSTGIPEVDEDKCTGCKACVKACPRGIIELGKKNKKNRRVVVSCVNKDKGGSCKKYCKVSCIGCKKCFKVCAHDAITVENNLAWIDSNKCKLCRKCGEECPTGAIREFNLPVKVKKVATTEASV